MILKLLGIIAAVLMVSMTIVAMAPYIAAVIVAAAITGWFCRGTNPPSNDS